MKLSKPSVLLTLHDNIAGYVQVFYRLVVNICCWTYFETILIYLPTVQIGPDSLLKLSHCEILILYKSPNKVSYKQLGLALILVLAGLVW